MKKRGKLLYSTDPKDDLEDSIEKEEDLQWQGQNARVRFEKKYRAGKPVSVISGLNNSKSKMEELASWLKKQCGCGGTYKEGNIEIQGDKRKQLPGLLQKKGIKARVI